MRPHLDQTSPSPPAVPGELGRRLARIFTREVTPSDRWRRRVFHGAGAFVLVYLVLPAGVFVVLPKEAVLLLALAAVVVLEILRLGRGLRLPTIRSYEARRPASYVFYAIALVVAVLLFPVPIATAVVLGTAIVDPIAGGLRGSERGKRLTPWLPFAVYTVLAGPALALVGHWPWAWAAGLAVLAGAVAVAVERWRFRWLDDDLTMTVVPALLLYAVGIAALGLPR